MSLVKRCRFIGLLGVVFGTNAVAGGQDYCQYLRSTNTVDTEPDFCIDNPSESIKSQTIEGSLNEMNLGSGSSTSFAFEYRTTDTMFTHPVDDLSTQTNLGTVTESLRAMAFDESANTLYALDNDAKALVTVDQLSGGLTTVGPLTNLDPTDDVTGLDIAPDGTCYVTSTDTTTNTLYTCDLATGTLTVVGSQTTTPFLVGIAADCDGNLYGHDIGSDSIYNINTSDGSASLIGATGIDANFTQDLTYDRESDTLFGYIYIGQSQNVYAQIDVCTGNATALNTDDPFGAYIGASKTDCALSEVIFSDGFDSDC